MKRILLFILTLIFISSCKPKQEEIKISGSFTIDETGYPLTSMRVDHVGYASSDSSAFILHATFSGYQGSINLFLTAPDNDFRTGITYDKLCSDSLSCVLITGDNPDTLPIASATLTVDSIADATASGKNWLNYHFTINLKNSASANGQFTGPHTVNYTVDQPSFGFITFDTIATGLARPSLYRWGRLFCDDSNYFELKFYSNLARFSDNGSISRGVQFVVGLHSFQQNFPAVGSYPIALQAKEATAYFGHRDGSVNWGTYWQTFYAGSVVGKANILADTINILRWDADTLSMTFSLKDQLGNTVKGNYNGRYY